MINPDPADAGELEPSIRVVYRSADGVTHLDWPADSLAETLQQPGGVLWIDIEDVNGGSSQIETLLRDVFHFHPLSVDDALRESHQPQLDDWGSYMYGVYHVLSIAPGSDDLCQSELDLFLGPNYLITYHTDPMPSLRRIRDQIERDPGSRMLCRGAARLLYQVLDLGMADYFVVVEHLDLAIDDLSDEVLDHPSTATLQRILKIKRSAVQLHRNLAPQREIMNRLARDPYPLIAEEERVYFRDVYDHLVRMHDITETVRDMIAGTLDTYLSATANRTNQVMKALTIVSVTVLPLNFLAGFFGMNFFGSMLELTSSTVSGPFLFALTCLTMIAAPVALGFWFKRRGWF